MDLQPPHTSSPEFDLPQISTHVGHIKFLDATASRDRHTSVDIPGYPNVSAAIERELVALRRQNSDLQVSNNSLRNRAQRAEDRVRVLEARESDGA